MLFKLTNLSRYFAVILLLFSPGFAFAYGGDTPVSQGLNYIIEAVYGTTGLSIATVAIIGMGLLCAGHYLEWKLLERKVTVDCTSFPAKVPHGNLRESLKVM